MKKELYSSLIMLTLPDSIKITLFKVLDGDFAIEDFEEWVYSDAELESALTADSYLDLISLDYKKSGAKYELFKLIGELIDSGEYEMYKLLKLVKNTMQKDEKLPYYLMEFYHLYCDGYDFLREIGLNYGLSVDVPPNADSWADLTSDQQQELLASFSPGLELEIQRLVNWLQSGKIILTGQKGEYGRYIYTDYRDQEERK